MLSQLLGWLSIIAAPYCCSPWKVKGKGKQCLPHWLRHAGMSRCKVLPHISLPRISSPVPVVLGALVRLSTHQMQARGWHPPCPAGPLPEQAGLDVSGD